MASFSDSNNALLKKRSRQDSSGPETSCQKCDKIIKEKIMCQGCKLDYCINCAGITPTLFECLIQGEMEDFFWSCKSCKATFPSLDNITKILKDSQEKSNARMNKIEDRISCLESSKDDMRQSVLLMKDEIVSSVKEDINKLVDTRHSELEDRKRRETNITIFNLTEHNFATGSENKMADEQDFNLLCSSLGIETQSFSNCFRLGRKTANKIRPLKVLLNSKVQRRTLLENAKYIKEKAPPNMTRVIISRDLTPLQRNERKQRRQQNRR